MIVAKKKLEQITEEQYRDPAYIDEVLGSLPKVAQSFLSRLRDISARKGGDAFQRAMRHTSASQDLAAQMAIGPTPSAGGDLGIGGTGETD
jgi:hypothetical protein